MTQSLLPELQIRRNCIVVNDWIINEPFTRLKLWTWMSNKQIALQPKITSTLAISSLRLTDDQRTLLYGDNQIRLAYHFPPLIPYWSSTRRDHLISSHGRLLLVRCGSAESTSRLLTLSVATLPNQITLSLYYHLPLSCPSRFPSDRLQRAQYTLLVTPCDQIYTAYISVNICLPIIRHKDKPTFPAPTTWTMCNN